MNNYLRRVIFSIISILILTGIAVYLAIYTNIPISFPLIPWFLLCFILVITPSIFLGYNLACIKFAKRNG